MASAPVIATMSVEEYLNTAFRPDVDFVDGVIEERNLGEKDHARLQTMIARMLGEREEEWGIEVDVELRVQVGEKTYRVPDVCVTDARVETEQIVRTPPLLCVEVVSPTDSVKSLLERATDFHRNGGTGGMGPRPQSAAGVDFTAGGVGGMGDRGTDGCWNKNHV